MAGNIVMLCFLLVILITRCHLTIEMILAWNPCLVTVGLSFLHSIVYVNVNEDVRLPCITGL